MAENKLIATRVDDLYRTLPFLHSTGFTKPWNSTCMVEPTDDDYGNMNASYNNVFPTDGRLLIDSSRITLGVIIGEGYHSEVYEGTYKSKPVAVKIIKTNDFSSRNAAFREKFQREVTLLSRMNHESIIKLVGITLHPRMMIVTELIRGGNLQNFLWSIRPVRLDIEHSVTLALEISKAMEYLHSKGVIHRDLKPSNILLCGENKIKLADFGLAREEVADGMTSEAGTYRWMAPEVFTVDSHTRDDKLFYNRKVDVYSFSLVLWELVVNQTPFSGKTSLLAAYAAASKNERPSVEDLPEDIANLLKCSWAQDPRCRPEFKEITEALTEYLHKICPPKKTDHEADRAMKGSETRGSKKRHSFFNRLVGCFGK